MNAKSFKVPSKLRFLVRPNANSDIRIRSSAMSAAATPTMANLRTPRGKHRAQPLRLTDRNDDRKSRPFADEKQVLASADPEDVAVPVAEPRRGLDGRQVADLFQPDKQLLCAAENDHQFVSASVQRHASLIACTMAGMIVTWIRARNWMRS